MHLKTSSFILGALNLRPQEASSLMFMLGHAFFNGLGIALSFTTINILLLENHGIRILPVLYIIISVILLAGGLVYAQAEHHIRPSRLFKMVIAISAVWAIFIRFFLVIEASLLLVGFAFCTYYLIYLLLNLEFWGVAALLFNIRQGKRLFGPLSVGESLAKILGYAITPVVVAFFSLPDTLLFAGLSFLISLLLLHLLKRRVATAFQLEPHPHPQRASRHFKRMGILHILNRLKMDSFARNISVFAIISTLIYFIIQYGFLAQVDTRIHGLKDTALFFGIFYSAAKAINLFIKIFLSGRILNYFGIRYTLLILPTCLLLANLAGASGVFILSPETQFFIWIFGINYLLDEAFRSSLYKPSYLILFQPLARNKRLEGHTLSKGIMEPLGMGAAGALILVLNALEQFTLQTLVFCILLFSIAWIVASFQVAKEYLHILSKALKSRLLKRGSYHYSKEELRQLRDIKLKSHDPYEVIYAARMLEDEIKAEAWKSVVARLIRIDDKWVLLETLAIIEQYNLVDYAHEVKSLIFSEDKALSDQAAYCYTALKEEECVAELLQHMKDTDISRRNAIIGGILKHAGLYGAVSVGEHFLPLITSEDTQDRMNAASIIGFIANPKYYHPLLILLQDDALVVRMAAIKASVNVVNPKLLNPILDQASSPPLFGYCLNALEAFGEKAIPLIRQRAAKADRKLLKNLIKICSRINAPTSHHFLLKYIRSKDAHIRNAAITGLFTLKYQATAEHKAIILEALQKNVEVLKQLLVFCQECTKNEMLATALKNEVSAVLLPHTLYLLSFLYNRNVVSNIIDNTKIPSDDYRSNALELLENLLKRKDARKVLPLIEEILALDAGYKTGSQENMEEMIRSILSQPAGFISDWLMGISIRVCRENRIEVPDACMTGEQINSSTLLKEEITLCLQLNQ